MPFECLLIQWRMRAQRSRLCWCYCKKSHTRVIQRLCGGTARQNVYFLNDSHAFLYTSNGVKDQFLFFFFLIWKHCFQLHYLHYRKTLQLFVHEDGSRPPSPFPTLQKHLSSVIASHCTKGLGLQPKSLKGHWVCFLYEISWEYFLFHFNVKVRFYIIFLFSDMAFSPFTNAQVTRRANRHKGTFYSAPFTAGIFHL